MIINDISFTQREIEIVSCLLNGRTSKSIALLFSISSRTVETHIRNINMKIGVTSRQSLINFFETHQKLDYFKELYIRITQKSRFLEHLHKIRHQLVQRPLIIYCKNQKHRENLFQALSADLNIAKINANVIEYKDHNLNFLPNEFSLLLIEKNIFSTMPEEFKKFEVIDISYDESYNFSFLKILKKLFPNQDFTTFTDNFYESSVDSQNLIESNRTRKSVYPLKIKRYFFSSYLIAIFLFIGLSFGWLLFDKRSEMSSVRSDLPIPSEANLLKRDELLSKIEDHLEEQDGIQKIALVGIVGMGGVGKTTIARQLGRLQQSYVVWEINAVTKNSLVNSFKSLAYHLAETDTQKSELQYIQDIKDSAEREKQILVFIKKYLKSKSNWFLIYDNVDVLSNIEDYFPYDPMVWGSGKVILTTRNSNIKKSNYIQPNHIIEMGELNKIEALTLFSKVRFNCEPDKLSPIQKEEALKFLEHIPPFPLDIGAAGFYLKNTNIPYIIYLKHLKEHSQVFESMQESLLKETGYYSKTRDRIISLSLRDLIVTHKDFVDLLLLIALCNLEKIPRSLLYKFKEASVVDNFIYHLKKRSFIIHEDFSSPEEATFSIHRFTKSYILKELKDYEKSILKVKNFLSSKKPLYG